MDITITLRELKAHGLDPIPCPCEEEGPHAGGPSGYVVISPGMRSRPLHPCAKHLAGYLRTGWFVRELA